MYRALTGLFYTTVEQFGRLKHRDVVTVHGTLKLENRNWKFGLHTFVLLMNAFNFRSGFSTIALYSVVFDPDKAFLLIVPLVKVMPDHI